MPREVAALRGREDGAHLHGIQPQLERVGSWTPSEEQNTPRIERVHGAPMCAHGDVGTEDLRTIERDSADVLVRAGILEGGQLGAMTTSAFAPSEECAPACCRGDRREHE